MSTLTRRNRPAFKTGYCNYPDTRTKGHKACPGFVDNHNKNGKAICHCRCHHLRGGGGK